LKGRSEKLSEYKTVRYIIAELYFSLFHIAAQEGELAEAVGYLVKGMAYSPKPILKPRPFLSINYRLAESLISILKNRRQSLS
jgi:hypothetical protein